MFMRGCWGLLLLLVLLLHLGIVSQSDHLRPHSAVAYRFSGDDDDRTKYLAVFL